MFVDTGYVIALINQADQYHTQALQLAATYQDYPLVTTDAVLLEIGNALARIARSEAVAILRYFQTASEVTIVPLTTVRLSQALMLYEQYQDKTWGLVDCVSFVVMQEFGLDCVLGFDRHFQQAGFTLASSQT
ncbi:MAG: type II toxin-antitoxin system VapC family toxin [Prochlorothrix sp.]